RACRRARKPRARLDDLVDDDRSRGRPRRWGDRARGRARAPPAASSLTPAGRPGIAKVEEGLDAYRTFRREQGDFEALFRAHYPEIVRYLAVRLGSRDDALDLASEVFAEAWRRVPGLQWRGRPVRAWLYRVAGNMAADELKRRQRVQATARAEARADADDVDT